MRPGMMRRLTNADAPALDLIAVTIKPTRPPAGSTPPTEPPPGISRTTVLETREVRVARVTFAPKSREPVHTHPNDLLTIQISGGRLDIVNGSDRSKAFREPGFVQFVPRNVPHAFVSLDTKPFEILSVTIK
jgi:quercetin dioxygenase-like cupin family protein